MFGNLMQDICFGWRMLLKSPGFTITTIITLALAIGVNTAIFCFVDGFLLKPLPYPDAGRIVALSEIHPKGLKIPTVSALTYLDWVKFSTGFTHIAARSGVSPVTLTGTAEPMRVRAMQVTPGYFEIFGIVPFLGRTFYPDEGQPGNESTVVIGNSLWRNRFGEDKDILGKRIALNNQFYTVIGVLPAGGMFDRDETQVWMPLIPAYALDRPRDFRWMYVSALLKPDVSFAQAAAEMNTIAAQLDTVNPAADKGWGIAVDHYEDVLIDSDAKRVLLIIMVTTGMILLIGCVNIANLFMVQAAKREREVAIRVALGASRGRLMRQFLTESLLISCLGGILGIGVGYGAFAALWKIIPPDFIPHEIAITLNVRELAFALLLSLLTGIIFGLILALRISRVNLNDIMKEGSMAAGAGKKQKFINRALVVAEIAATFILLTGAVILMQSLYRIVNVDPGFDATNVLTAEMPLPARQSRSEAQINTYLHTIKSRVEAVPGVLEAGFTTILPLKGNRPVYFALEGPIAGRPDNLPLSNIKIVSPSYFRVLGIRLFKGRALEPADTPGSPYVAVVNKSFANSVFPGQEPLGRSLYLSEFLTDAPVRIVGVINNEKTSSLVSDPPACIYLSAEQRPMPATNLVVRTARNPLLLEKSVTAAIHEVDKEQLVADVSTMERILSEYVWSDRILTQIMGILAGVALLLALAGIYSLMSQTVTRRTHEFGIRAALGATPGGLLWLVLKGGLLITVIGLALGVLGAVNLVRVLQGLIYGVEVHDPMTFVTIAVFVVIMTLLACLIPARRAAGMDILEAIRHE